VADIMLNEMKLDKTCLRILMEEAVVSNLIFESAASVKRLWVCWKRKVRVQINNYALRITEGMRHELGTYLRRTAGCNKLL
jgi:hypothetical protein